ncbi:FAD-binding oxidoreductase [Salinibacter ruber]|uniref:FAD-binding oxidoreductase n=1 Tax=Salinibacter ruber TaxID=146919 RepID=UPI0021699406|nr:FAD-binding oxidoreductase [Salinibacter ruber]MCS4187841.1 FAD/FMN-containing dehydrogenase [Salinibacter ruber]
MSASTSNETVLSGWGRHPTVKSRVSRPEKRAALQSVLEEDGQPVIARGAGRSYGDASLLDSGGTTLLTGRLNRMLSFDSDTGVLRAEAGVRLREILEAFVPRGWFLPVTPGTKEVTLGGAVAFDIHGKNHHRDGGISNFVREIELLTAGGKTVTCGPEQNADLFWATVSGAGLTGIITEVALELRPIETAYVAERTLKADNLEDAFQLFEEHEPDYLYSVAWIDCLASGDSLGRSHLMFGRHATPDELSAKQRRDPLGYEPDHLASLPFDLPEGVLSEHTVKAFNKLYYARQRKRDKRAVVGIDPFFYPLDAIGDWNRMYGESGFVQFQCVLPMEESYDGLKEILGEVQESGLASFLAVLKRMGPPDGGLLTFPMRGYTLALDIPRRKGLEDLLRDLHETVARRGGRVYLAKDAYLRPDTFREMYPALGEWLEVKRRVDPENRFTSAQAQRLGIEP